MFLAIDGCKPLNLKTSLQAFKLSANYLRPEKYTDSKQFCT